MKQRETFDQILVHAGQHYDDALSQLEKKTYCRKRIPKEKIVFVGNAMIDTLLKFRQQGSHVSLVDRFRVTR